MVGTIQLVGVLTTMALLFKHGKREDLVDYGMEIILFQTKCTKLVHILEVLYDTIYQQIAKNSTRN